MLLVTVLACLATFAQGQGQPFAPAVTVNGQSITNWQVEQRARFLALLRAPDATFENARDILTQEALQLQAARAEGIELTPEELDAGLVEFAARGNLSPDQFITLLNQAGIAPETFRDFVRNGSYWRKLVQQRFGVLARPSDAEVERTVARGGTPGSGVRVLLSEIALPQTPETRNEVQVLAQRLSDTLSGQEAFQQAARRYSRSQTASRGGRLDWVPLSQLAPPIAAQVLALSPGEVSNPIDLGGFIGLYLLRDLEDGGSTGDATSVDYAEYLIPGGRGQAALSQAAGLRARIDTCDDLYGVAKGQPAGVLSRQTVPVGSLPGDLRQELAKLDDDEVSTLLTRDGFLRFVMLCSRGADAPTDAFDAIGQQIVNERLSSYAQGLQDELRANAIIQVE
ncbi:MAG: peptidylprolyl isomerase [Jannaschia sp.]